MQRALPRGVARRQPRNQAAGYRANDTAIADDRSTGIPNHGAHLVDGDALAVLERHATGAAGGHAALAGNIARLGGAAKLLSGHAVVATGHLSLGAELDERIIQLLIL